MLIVRTLFAFAALAIYVGIAIAPGTRVTPMTEGPPDPARWLLLIPVLLVVPGLVARRPWGRWLGLAVALGVLPWAIVFTFDAGSGIPADRGAAALVASVVLLLALTGRTMFRAFEGEASHWQGRRMGLVRWTLICNLAAVLTLYLFVVAYRSAFAWHFAVFGTLLLGLLAGTFALARQKTMGLLLVWLCSFAILPAGAWFVAREAASAGEAVLFAAAFLPAIATAWTTLVLFARPLWRSLR